MNKKSCSECKYYDVDKPIDNFGNSICNTCLGGGNLAFEPNSNKNISETTLALSEKWRLLYGDVFPEPQMFSQVPFKSDSINVTFTPEWVGVFTFRNARDYEFKF